MAYGLRLRIEYKDINEVLTRINIYQEDYSGSADVRYAHSGIKVEWGDQGDSKLPLVYGSDCTIFFDSEFDYEFLYLFSADSRKHRVEIEKNSSLFWTGYIEPDGWSEPLISTPYPVQAKAYDGLGFLRDIDFVDDSGDAYIGEKTSFDIIKICLLKTGLDLTINSAIDWEELEQTAGTDILKVHQHNCDNFTGMKCYDVLVELLHECRIFQRSGQWWIISHSNWVNSSFDYFITTAGGSTSTGTLNPTASGFWFEGEATLEILPAIKQLIVTHELGLNANLITNGSFTDYNDELAKFDTWTNHGVTPEQRDLDKDGNKFVYIPGKQYPDTFAHGGYGLIDAYISKQLAIKQTTSIVKISMKYAEMGTRYSSLMFIAVRLFGSVDNWYLRRKPFVEQVQEFEWVKVACKPAQGDDYITLGSHLQVTKQTVYTPPCSGTVLGIANYYYNTYDNVTAWAFDKVADHFENFIATVPGIPESGLLEFDLYVPYSNLTEVTGSCFTGIKLELLDENEDKYPSTIAYKVVNSTRNNYVPEGVTTKVGDYPDLPNTDILYTSGMQRLDGSFTSGWKRTADANYYTYAEFIAMLMAAVQRTPRQSYQARVADIIPRLNMVIQDANNGGMRLVENGISYDDRFQAVDGRYTEIKDISFSELTVTIAQTFDDTGAPKNQIGVIVATANPVNIDQRVTIVDTKSAEISAPSHMSGDYFETIVLEDGTFLIQPAKYSVIPYALTPDAGQPQFTLKGLIVEANVGGDYNELSVSAGTIVSLNFNALDKSGIQEKRDLAEAYDPTRSWTISLTGISLITDDLVFLYAKVPVDDGETTGELVVDTGYVVPTFDPDYIYYLLGVINAPIDGVRQVSMLWGNVKPEAATSDSDWITAEYRDVEAGTADSHILNVLSSVPYTIDHVVLLVDDGTLEVTLKINGTAVTGLSAISATTTKTSTAATALNTVSVNDEVSVEWSTTYTGTPTQIYIELHFMK